MKTLIFIISILAFVFSVSAQSNCPNVSVSGPPNIIAMGEQHTFTANLDKEAAKYQVKYFWTISGGQIVEGQGTNILKAIQKPDDFGKTLTATVEIKGLPQGCLNIASASGEIIDPPPCPAISVTGPNSLTPIGDSMTFTANLGYDSYKFSFEWTVSAGTITKGQGTSTITVATNSDVAGQTITASVKISGLVEGCKNKAIQSGEVEQQLPRCILPRIDEYGKLSWRDERIRLETVANELVNDNKKMAYFIVNTNEKRYSQMLKIREAKIRKYLFEKHKISKERIRLVYGGKGNYRTTVWITPIDAVPPQ